MNCPDCGSTRATRLQRPMNLGDAMFRCKTCRRTFNERTGAPFNFTFGAHRYRVPSAAVPVALQAQLSRRCLNKEKRRIFL